MREDHHAGDGPAQKKRQHRPEDGAFDHLRPIDVASARKAPLYRCPPVRRKSVGAARGEKAARDGNDTRENAENLQRRGDAQLTDAVSGRGRNNGGT